MFLVLEEKMKILLQNTIKVKILRFYFYKKNPNIHIDFYNLINIIKEIIMENNTECKKRKNVENNGYELIVALCLSDENIRTKEDCMNVLYEYFCKKVKGCSEEDFNKYKEDIEKRKDNDINKYISKFVNEFQEKNIKINEITEIYLEGKNETSPKIKELNRGQDIKNCKADVYFELIDKTIIGVSIKQDNKCTKSNYSVEKILDSIKEKEKGNLSNLRKKLLETTGFKEFEKDKRKDVNTLFYDSNNEYWKEMKQEINEYNEIIKKRLIEYLYPVNLSYDIWEFDGEKIENLKINIDNSTFKEHEPYYYTKKGIRRKAAKLFYQLIIDNKKYRVEIRWKGNIHGSSPQFQIHLE